MARAREAELEASGRAQGLQQTVNVLTNQVFTLQATNDMLLSRVMGGAPVAAVPVAAYGGYPSVGLPDFVGGVPAGSPVPAHVRPAPQAGFEVGGVGLPMPGAPARSRRGPVAPEGYAFDGDLATQVDFNDMGDKEAERQGIRLDEATGALLGGPGSNHTQ